MSILKRYIVVQFLHSALMITVGLSAIFLVFDVLAHAGEITENSANVLQTLLNYMVLRLPGIVVLIIPMAALLAAMTTMHKMVKSREMLVLANMGVPIYKVTYIFAFGALILALTQFCVAEFSASTSLVQLRLWAEQDYQGQPPEVPEHNKTLWVSAEPYIIHYDSTSADGHVLFNPLFIQRSEGGQIEEYTRANRAIYRGDHWILKGAYGNKTRHDVDGASVMIGLNLKPSDLSIPAQNYNEIRLSELWPVVFSIHKVKQAQSIYVLWFQRKLAQPLSTILMAMMAAPIGLFMARQYNGFLLSFSFIMGGFIFFVSERLLLSMGESFILPSFLAVWSPHLIFGTMSLWFTLYKQES